MKSITNLISVLCAIIVLLLQGSTHGQPAGNTIAMQSQVGSPCQQDLQCPDRNVSSTWVLTQNTSKFCAGGRCCGPTASKWCTACNEEGMCIELVSGGLFNIMGVGRWVSLTIITFISVAGMVFAVPTMFGLVLFFGCGVLGDWLGSCFSCEVVKEYRQETQTVVRAMRNYTSPEENKLAGIIRQGNDTDEESQPQVSKKYLSMKGLLRDSDVNIEHPWYDKYYVRPLLLQVGNPRLTLLISVVLGSWYLYVMNETWTRCALDITDNDVLPFGLAYNFLTWNTDTPGCYKEGPAQALVLTLAILVVCPPTMGLVFSYIISPRYPETDSSPAKLAKSFVHYRKNINAYKYGYFWISPGERVVKSLGKVGDLYALLEAQVPVNVDRCLWRCAKYQDRHRRDEVLKLRDRIMLEEDRLQMMELLVLYHPDTTPNYQPRQFISGYGTALDLARERKMASWVEFFITHGWSS